MIIKYKEKHIYSHWERPKIYRFLITHNKSCQIAHSLVELVLLRFFYESPHSAKQIFELRLIKDDNEIVYQRVEAFVSLVRG